MQDQAGLYMGCNYIELESRFVLWDNVKKKSIIFAERDDCVR